MSKLWKANFFILCDVIVLVSLQGIFHIDHPYHIPQVNYSRTSGEDVSEPKHGKVTTFELRPRQNEDTLWRQRCVLRCCLPWQNTATLSVARRSDTIDVSGDFQEHFLLCPGHKICVRHKCCAHGKTNQHLRNMITSAILPPQCVLVLPTRYGLAHLYL